MTFKERYEIETTWHGKAAIMEVYHLTMCFRHKGWTVTQTAFDFGCSLGLVSENLRLAYIIHLDPNLLKCESRQEALRKIKQRRNND